MKQFEFTTTHALSVLVVLLITIFLFQPSIFGTMINTFLGRLTLLFILILITSYHTMCGLVSVLLIIALYEYYNRFEGQTNLSDSHLPPPPTNPAIPVLTKEEVKPNESGLQLNAPASIPPDEPNHSPVNTSAMDSTKKTELERNIQNGNNSKQLHPTSTSSNANVAPSESTKTSSTSTKQGFANMFGNDWASF
jgi:hypothetical protein